jgi:hypothetical protein
MTVLKQLYLYAFLVSSYIMDLWSYIMAINNVTAASFRAL